MFKGRKLLIATKHQKEDVIKPIVEKELQVACFVDLTFDTDTLGTFTGEIERAEDPISTVRTKCLLAMKAANCDLAIASEGSFGPHPSIFFVPANEEFILLIDKKNGLEVLVKELSTKTNFNGSVIKTREELDAFSESANFPSHGLILRSAKDDFTEVVKGITDKEMLYDVFTSFTSRYGETYVETDMRAMVNPTRMEVIKKATKKLIEKINTQCPACQTPGFGITETVQGLQCQVCHSPTRSILYHVYTCQKCLHAQKSLYPSNKYFEDPMYCDTCNP